MIQSIPSVPRTYTQRVKKNDLSSSEDGFEDEHFSVFLYTWVGWTWNDKGRNIRLILVISHQAKRISIFLENYFFSHGLSMVRQLASPVFHLL